MSDALLATFLLTVLTGLLVAVDAGAATRLTIVLAVLLVAALLLVAVDAAALLLTVLLAALLAILPALLLLVAVGSAAALLLAVLAALLLLLIVLLAALLAAALVIALIGHVGTPFLNVMPLIRHGRKTKPVPPRFPLPAHDFLALARIGHASAKGVGAKARAAGR